jgi:hypothetical protein
VAHIIIWEELVYLNDIFKPAQKMFVLKTDPLRKLKILAEVNCPILQNIIG